ncbi:MAG: glutamine synthetase family protein [Gammaproteobacteria bacterium]
MIEVLFTDINGMMRGKRVGREDFAKVFDPGINLPGATALLDSKGMTFDCITNGNADGDPDMICPPVDKTSVYVPWANRPTAQTLVSMYDAAGKPYFADSRHVLQHALLPLKKMGLTPVVAIELEFYLLDGQGEDMPRPKLGRIPGTTIDQDGPQYNSLDDLTDLDAYFADVETACRVQNIPASAALAEFAAGQYEINLHHVADPLLACAHAVMLKRVVKSVARKHGMGASFMAKPFADFAGCGLHVHVSLLDRKGNNVFADSKTTTKLAISPTLRHAIGGLAATMDQAMAIFAPNANSYRRLRPALFVPLTPNWGMNHRRLALRIPLSEKKDMRVEHRVAGADANPYLVVAAILAGIHHGLTNQCDPGPMVPAGEIIDEKVTLPLRWDRALDLFEQSTILPHYLGEEFCKIFALCRREECNRFHNEVNRQDYEWYLRNV